MSVLSPPSLKAGSQQPVSNLLGGCSWELLGWNEIDWNGWVYWCFCQYPVERMWLWKRSAKDSNWTQIGSSMCFWFFSLGRCSHSWPTGLYILVSRALGLPRWTTQCQGLGSKISGLESALVVSFLRWTCIRLSRALPKHHPLHPPLPKGRRWSLGQVMASHTTHGSTWPNMARDQSPMCFIASHLQARR